MVHKLFCACHTLTLELIHGVDAHGQGLLPLDASLDGGTCHGDGLQRHGCRLGVGDVTSQQTQERNTQNGRGHGAHLKSYVEWISLGF